METPSYSHLSANDYNCIYEPAEDTFLLIDALEMELEAIKLHKPLITVEIGPGSGIVISALAKYLNFQSHGFFAIDINKFACDATQRTARANSVNVDVINMDLLTSFKENSIDLLVFNPPYVPTETIEDDSDGAKVYKNCDEKKMLTKSWAGGKDGCEIINRVLLNLDKILSERGIFYLLLIKENKPEKIVAQLKQMGFNAVQIIDRKIRGEHLLVLKIFKSNYK
jgi:release factor glutamine methyltransferase